MVYPYQFLLSHQLYRKRVILSYCTHSKCTCIKAIKSKNVNIKFGTYSVHNTVQTCSCLLSLTTRLSSSRVADNNSPPPTITRRPILWLRPSTNQAPMNCMSPRHITYRWGLVLCGLGKGLRKCENTCAKA